MKKLLMLFLALALLSVAQGQNDITKKCKTCGKPLKECPYKGRHTNTHTQQSVQKEDLKMSSSYLRMDGNDIVFDMNGTEYRYNLVIVEGGSFLMGATENDGEVFDYEKPQRKKTVKSFYIGQTEVTQALWMAVMGNNPSHWKGYNLPVEQVSYNDCKEFIQRINILTERQFGLPSEEEWEYAARGGNRSKGYKYSGGNNLGLVAWYYNNSGNKTHNVAQKEPNELGLYDMTGNVWEWCSSKFGNTKWINVLRGCCWDTKAKKCRLSINDDNDSTNPGNKQRGFRLVMR